MFTGIVEALGDVIEVRSGSGSRRLRIGTPFGRERLAPGDSLAVDGVCLTVVANDGHVVDLDAVAETLRLTTLGELEAGSRVHLERALRVGDPLGGHLVQGHVDGTVEIVSRDAANDDYRLTLAVPGPLARYVAHKGSVTLAGVSLTVAGEAAGRFAVALIPETLRKTHLGSRRPGDRLNVEVDLLARYLERLVRPREE
jgi:riboflavin synthase